MNIPRKTVLFTLLVVFVVASLPLTNVSAAGQHDPSMLSQGSVTNERLEQIWAHQLRIYNRLGHVDQFKARVQRLIDRASANGKDVSAVQTALEDFKTAAREAHPVYESMTGMVNSHQGFDENGKVTDPVKAQETVKAMHEKIQQVRTTMDGTGKALHEAIRTFRQSNPRPQPSITPTAS